MSKFILTSIASLLFWNAAFSGEVFDSQTLPLSINIGIEHGIDAKSLDQANYPTIRYEDLERGLYVVPNALEANFTTAGAWDLYLSMGEQYHDDHTVGIYPQHEVLWRHSNTKEPFQKIDGQNKNLIKSGSDAVKNSSEVLDIAFRVNWSTPINFEYTFPFTFSLEEKAQ